MRVERCVRVEIPVDGRVILEADRQARWDWGIENDEGISMEDVLAELQNRGEIEESRGWIIQQWEMGRPMTRIEVEAMVEAAHETGREKTAQTGSLSGVVSQDLLVG